MTEGMQLTIADNNPVRLGAEYTFEEGIKETIQWYLDNTEWIENVVSGDYMKYYDKMYSNISNEEVAATKE